MRNHHALPTVALLSSYLEKERKDYLHLLSPFVQCCLPTTVNEEIDIQKITQNMRSRFGFEDIPTRVVELLLNRLSRPSRGSVQFLKREKRKYYLKKPFDCSTFNKERSLMREKINSVLESLGIFLGENYLNKKVSIDEARDFFMHFFEAYGWIIAKDKEQLRTVTSDDGRHNFFVARFILEQYDKQTVIAEYITEIAKGFLVYRALYFFSSEKKTSIDSKLRDVVFYLDCSLVIDCLGYDCAGDEESLDELIHMIKDMSGHVSVFSHTIEEASNLLDAYAKHHNNRNAFNFPQLDAKRLSPDILAMYATTSHIQKCLIEKDIDIIDAPSYETNKESPLVKQYVGFQDETKILEQLKSYSSKASKSINHKRHDYDLKSLAAIGMLRKSKHPRLIEKSFALLITQDRRLCWCMHDLYPKEFPPETDFAFTDVDLISILWVGRHNKESNLPQDLLIANASAACELSPEVMNRAIELVDQMQAGGRIDSEAALIVRTMPIIKKYLFENTYNNVSMLTEEVIISTIEKFVTDSSKDSRDEAIKKALEDNKKEQKKTAIKAINKKATRYSKTTGNIVFWSLSILHAVLAIIAIVALFSIQDYSNKFVLTLLIVFLVYCVLQITDIFFKGMNIIRKISKKCKCNMYTWMYKKGIREYKRYGGDVEV